MGIDSAICSVVITNPGVLTTVPSNPVSQLSSSGAGTGATFTVVYPQQYLVTTILTYGSATSITLNAPATSSTTTAKYTYGTDDGPALNAAITAANSACLPVQVPAGLFLTNQTLAVSFGTLRGAGRVQRGAAQSHPSWVGCTCFLAGASLSQGTVITCK